MRAIVQERYGTAQDLALREVPVPSLREDEVLVRTRASSVHPDVWHMVTGRPWVLRLMGGGALRPKVPIPGTDVAGVVERVGGGVQRFAPGDEVFGETTRGYTWANGGAFAEYVAMPEQNLARKPANVTFEQAGAIPSAGFITLMNLRGQASPRAGQRVLVNGAAGGVGSIALQLAKAEGAEVTGVELEGKLDVVRALGADRVLAAGERFTSELGRYDLLVDVASNLSLAMGRSLLKPSGKYVLIGHDHFGANGRSVLGSLPRFAGLMALTPFVDQLPRASLQLPAKQEVMERLRGLLEAGALRPIIDRSYPLDQAAQALEYLASGQAKGRVVLTA